MKIARKHARFIEHLGDDILHGVLDWTGFLNFGSGPELENHAKVHDCGGLTRPFLGS